ncbi:N-acetyltransferase [Halarchaeum grantii]|uniref:N-acetyltransferase n=1 Tax=Halarchaeum grantii TaxID=1193105 RepID=A0A830FC21_9EURY|nr:GNAT family N-acetyltransferase [Halarchaeum grantii]GGL39610.1 N-acetyltransferase [Halarchaeum grantii]
MTDPTLTVNDDYDYRTYDRDIDRQLAFRPASESRDLGRLHRWLGSEHVQPYWELDLPLPAFRERLREKLADDHLTPYIGCLDHVPMSYWECYWAAEDDVAAHYDADPADRGVHLLIGPTEYLGQGYAVPLLRAVTAMQFRHPETDRVVAEPDARNDAARRVFEHCGFRDEGAFRFEEAGKDARLLVCERERFERDVAPTPASGGGER